jgi:oligoendopeptidase F
MADPITWSLSSLFASDTDPAIEESRAVWLRETDAFVAKWKDRTDYLTDPAVLREALDEFENWIRDYGVMGTEGYYFFLRYSQDQTDTTLKAKMQLLDDFSREIGNKIRFFEHRIAKIPQDQQKMFLAAPELALYHHYLEQTFRDAKYLLSEPEEKTLAAMQNTSYSNWVDMVESFVTKEERVVLDDDGNEVTKDFSSIITLISNRSKPVRDRAAEALNDILATHIASGEAEINAVVQYKKASDTLRGIDRPDRTRHLSDDIDTEVVDAMLDAVEKRFDISQKWYQVKANLLGIKKLEYHERNVGYGEVDKKYPWEDTVALVGRVLHNLDPEFGSIFDGYRKNGHFDVFPQKVKADGAFCAYGLKIHPSYILLNHNDTLRDVLTLAHEVGHGINNEFVKKTQPAIYFGTPTSTAEVASTFMEDFVLRELANGLEDHDKLTLLVMKIDEEVSTIFRQVACYRFEQALHTAIRSRGYLSSKEIGELFTKHMKAYMGPAIEQSPGSQNWWLYWSHIRKFFYVYSYASGLLISKQLQNQVHKDSKKIAGVKTFLSAGHAKSPAAIFQNLGIDITSPAFWNEGLAEIEQTLKEVEMLAKKISAKDM